MIKIVATTLEEAYSRASQELDCSITELNFEVVQQPNRGFMGLFKKSAIIIATCKVGVKKPIKLKKEYQKTQKPSMKYQKKSRQQPKDDFPSKKERKKESFNIQEPKSGKDIFDNFYSSSQQKEQAAPMAKKEYQKSQKPQNALVDISDTLLDEIKKDLYKLIKLSCYDITSIDVSKYDDKTILIKLDGKDVALLIGKDGYRYKAISYMLFNWINPKYNLLVRLEIAEFLQNQEDMIYNYIDTLYEKIAEQSRVQTKPLDGILLHIALGRLRELYPDKYVAIKQKNSARFIVINDFNKQQ